MVVKSSQAFYNQLFLVLKPNRKWRPILDLKSIESIPQYQYVQKGNPGNSRVDFTDRGMDNFTRLQRCVFPHPNQSKVTKISRFFPATSNLPIHSSSLWFGQQLPSSVQRWSKIAQAKGIRIHQYLDDWLLRAPCSDTCLQHIEALLALCQQLGSLVNMEEIRVEPPSRSSIS